MAICHNQAATEMNTELPSVNKNTTRPGIPALEGSVDRRTVLLAGAAAVISLAARAAPRRPDTIPIIDTHIHLFDPNRPQGAPYFGPPNSPTSKTGAFPDIYQRLAAPLGIVGALEVEASPGSRTIYGS